MASGAVTRSARPAPQQQLGEIDMGRATAVGLDDEDFAIVVRGWGRFEEWPCLCPRGAHNAECRSLARRPLAELHEGRASVGVRELRT
jgi:hypothetical protein